MQARRLVVGLGGVLLLAGCTASTLDPAAQVTVRGTALTPAGAPLVDRPVRLDSELAASDLLLALPTAGLACLGEGCGDALDEQRTGADGGFVLTTTGAATQTAFGGERTLAVTVSAAPSADQVTGASVTARFVARSTAPALPGLHLVDPGLRVTAREGRLEAQWDAGTTAQELRWLSGQDGRPVWTVPAAGTRAALDPRVLEGTRGAAVLTGSSTDGGAAGDGVTSTWVSPGTAYATAAATPVSRGARCGDPAQPCGLTDGDLGTPAGPAADCPDPATCRAVVQVDLAPAPTVDLLVVRGCDSGCDVAVSGPGGTRGLGRLSGDAAVALPPGPVSAVTVSGTDLAGLREISAWAPAPAAAPAALVGPDAGAVLGPAATSGDRPRLPLALAVVLVVAAAAAVGAVGLGRRAG